MDSPNNNCQLIVTALQDALNPFCAALQSKLSAGIRLRLDQQQLALLASYFNDASSIKVVILDTSIHSCQSVIEQLTAWNKLFDVNSHWHLIAQELSPQELTGAVVSSLSQTTHRLLGAFQPAGNNHYVLPTTALDIAVPSAQLYRQQTLRLHTGEQIPLQQLVRDLVGRGYLRYDTCSELGSFSVRGEQVDIKSPVLPGYLTVTFYGSAIESIVHHQQRRSQQVTSALVIPNKFPAASVPITQLLKDTLLFKPAHTKQAQGKQNIIHDALKPDLDFPLTTSQDLIQSHKQQHYVGLSHLAKGRSPFRQVAASEPRPVGRASLRRETAASIRPSRIGNTVREEAQPITKPLGKPLRADTESPASPGFVSASEKVLYVLCANRDRVTHYLRDRHQTQAILCRSSLSSTPLCLTAPTWVIVSEAALLSSTHPAEQPISYQRGLELLQTLKVNRPAVHSQHGIGIYEGLQRRTIDGTEREYLVLRYDGGDSLSVPVTYAHKVTAYMGGPAPALNRLGDASWTKTKRKARHNAAALAQQLIKLARTRAQSERPRYSIPATLNDDLNKNFPYTLTADQQRAWQDVQNDLMQSKPMDRLIVGDVGFGKTEIAIRAAYAAIHNGKQVALLAPTTLLVQQHLDTFLSRLPQLADRIGLLSRFTNAREQANTRQRIAQGSLAIAIGTHALLSPKTKWRNLGLVIIDEEQRFGVKQKDYFHTIRSDLDVLSLSATPIPRTLHMALSDLKSLSVITTPPAGRKNVITHIGSQDAHLVKALTRELDRGGQVYVVAPKVRQLPMIAEHIRQLVPTATIAQAHGQMDDATLASTMHRFDGKEIDILVCSTIIENGLDLPNVNTMIVFSATHFGLAELYQLRGRVGRRSTQGHVHFLYNQQELTIIQRQRLTALTEASRLGSGWELAQRDLEIRGAGNLLGAEQSGAIQAVGLGLYLDLVQEAVSDKQTSSQQEPDTDIQLPITATIPTHYIADIDERTRWYQRLTRAAAAGTLTTTVSELKQVYGPPPPATQNLLALLRLQLTGAQIGITKITSTTIAPPRRARFTRIIIHADNPPVLASTLSNLGTWQVRGNTLVKDVRQVTPQFIRRLADACDVSREANVEQKSFVF